VTVVDDKMRLLIRLEPKAYFISCISQISSRKFRVPNSTYYSGHGILTISGCSFKFILKAGVEESIVNAPLARLQSENSKTQTMHKVRLDLNS
jgi:hypothetical protein